MSVHMSLHTCLCTCLYTCLYAGRLGGRRFVRRRAARWQRLHFAGALVMSRHAYARLFTCLQTCLYTCPCPCLDTCLHILQRTCPHTCLHAQGHRSRRPSEEIGRRQRRCYCVHRLSRPRRRGHRRLRSAGSANRTAVQAGRREGGKAGE